MSLYFVLGASGSGKSTGMYRHFIEEALGHPDRQYMILVPDQYTMQIQKQMVLLHPGHAILNVDVLSFGRLYHKVMEELGGSELTALDDTGKNLILRKLAGSMKEELPVLGCFMDRQGYISEVKGLISEMQQYGISPDGMDVLIENSASRRGLQARLTDVQKLYRAYSEYLQDSYKTSESLYPILTGKLKESRLFADTEVLLDGFTGFTPVQLPLVQEIMLLAGKVYITMTIDEDPALVTMEQQLFYTSAKSIRDLERLAEEARVSVEPYIWFRENKRFGQHSALAHLEKNLFRSKPAVFSEASDAIRIIQAKNPMEESLFIAEEIKRLVREEGCQYRDIGVILADMESYRYHLQELFEEMEIPCFVDASSRILHNPAMEMLQGVLDILERDFSYAGVMRYLRSGFSALKEEEIDLLELYIQEAGIRGKRAYSRPFTRKGRVFALDRINEIRQKLMEELAPCLFTESISVRAYIERLYTFLVQVSAEEKLAQYADWFEEQGKAAKAREYRQIYRKLMELMEQMVALMGDEVLSLSVFEEILKAGFEELQVGLIPARVDQVLIGDLERTRLSQVRILFAAGVNDVNIPGSSVKGGMLSDMEREYLADAGVELAPTKRQLQFRQHFYLYQQLTKPSHRLYLSYALTDNEEKEIRPSYFIGTIGRLFPGVRIEAVPSQRPPEHLSGVLKQSTALLGRFAEGRTGRKEEERLFIYLTVLHKYLGEEETSHYIEQAFLEGGKERLSPELARALYGAVLYGSISRLEQYASCPYSHFLKYGLKLKEPSEYVLESTDLGTIFHDVLAGFGKDLRKDGYSWQDFPESYGRERIHARIADIRENYGEELLLDKARNGYALVRAERILNRSIQNLKTQMQAGAFRPAGYEVDFDVSCEWNASRELMMHLQGRIDRLDVAESGEDMYVKILDYKSGNKQFEMDYFYEGLQLQLIVYLDSASRILQERHPEKKVHPAAMFYYRVADPVVSMEGEEDLAGLPKALLKEQRARGLVNSDKRVVELLDQDMEGSSDVIPVAFTKSGVPTKNSQVCTEEQFLLMEAFAHKKLQDMGREIVNGHMEKRPYYRNKEEEGCTYCPYKGVCGFDEKQAGFTKRRIAKMESEEALKRMEEDLEKEGVADEIYLGPAEGH